MSRDRSNAKKKSTISTSIPKNQPVPETRFVLNQVKPITKTQSVVFKAYEDGYNLWLEGYAGCGKTFLALYLALNEISNTDSPYSSVTPVRSAVPTRDIGHLPGDLEEKTSVYEMPYYPIADELYSSSKSYSKLKALGLVRFLPTSFVRGTTLRNTIVIVDEAASLNFHELDTIITRLGKNAKAIFCGDFTQSDFTRASERDGYLQFKNIIEKMSSMKTIFFTKDDIVRGEFVKEYLLAKD